MTLSRIQPKDSSFPLGSSSSLGLPPDILQEASRRLGFISLFILISFIVIFGFTELTYFRNVIAELNSIRTIRYGLFSLVWIVSGVLFYLSKRKNDQPQLLLNLGLIYEVILASCVSFLINYQVDWTLEPAQLRLMHAPIGMLIIIFAVIISHKLIFTSIASVSAILMDPITIMLLMVSVKINELPSFSFVLTRILIHLFALAFAISINKIMYSYSTKITKARHRARRKHRSIRKNLPSLNPDSVDSICN